MGAIPPADAVADQGAHDQLMRMERELNLALRQIERRLQRIESLDLSVARAIAAEAAADRETAAADRVAGFDAGADDFALKLTAPHGAAA